MNDMETIMDFSKLIKEIKTDPANTPWYKKKVSIIAMSSTLGVGVLTTAIAVPVALTSGGTSTSTFEVTGIKNIYDLSTKNVKLIISGKGLPDNSTSYKVLSSTIKNARGPITSAVTLTQVSGGVQLGFTDSSLIATTAYQVVINDSTPIDVKQTDSFVQPIITIGTQPTSQTIADATTSKIVTLTIAASVQNKIPNYELSYQWQSSDTNDQNNDSTWTNISNALSSSYQVDATSFPAAVKKYFRCLVSYEFTEVKKSTSVYVEKAGFTPPPPTTDPTQAIATFNNKSVADKIAAYNTIMANTANNTAIKNYFFTSGGGMSQFFNENVMPITVSDPSAIGGDPKVTYDEFKSFLPTYTSTTIIYNPLDKSNFLKMKAVGVTDSLSGLTTNIGDNIATTNIYCEQVNSLSTNVSKYSFYSPIVDTIQNVTMNSDFSITMTLTSDAKVINAAFVLFKSNFHNVILKYKTTIKFSNTTLFPGMSDFVKRSILSITS